MGDTGSQDRTDTIDTPINGFHLWHCKSTMSRSSWTHTISSSFGSYMDGGFSNSKCAFSHVASPVHNLGNIDTLTGSMIPGLGAERILWPDVAESQTPEMTKFYQRLEGGNVNDTSRSDKMFLTPESTNFGSTGSFNRLTEETTATYMRNKQQSFRMVTQGPDLDLLQTHTSLDKSETEKMQLPEDLSAHTSCTPSNMFFDTSADFETSIPLNPEINPDPSNLMSLKGERVVNRKLVEQSPPLQPNSVSGWVPKLSTSSRHSTDASVLPQRMCYICGDEASGYHYGVLTCESCKVFFRRAFKGHQKYLCAGRNDCIVDKIRRKNCSACRFRKCYQAGMRLGDQKLNKKSMQKLNKKSMHKAMALPQPQSAPPAWGLSYNRPAMAPCPSAFCMSNTGMQIISILENIEPEMVLSGHDLSKPDLPHLLSTFNRLYDFQLKSIVTWSKSLPGFCSLPISDQKCLIQCSGMNLMLLSLGWRSFKNVTKEYLYFAPDLVMNEQRMRQSPIPDLYVAMQLIPCKFVNLQITKEEYLCMKAVTLFNTVPLEGLKNQEQFQAIRQDYIQQLTKAIQLKESESLMSSQRFYCLTKLMETIHEVAKMANVHCANVFIQANDLQVEFPKMMSEVITAMFPKFLEGTLTHLPFHGK